MRPSENTRKGSRNWLTTSSQNENVIKVTGRLYNRKIRRIRKVREMKGNVMLFIDGVKLKALHVSKQRLLFHDGR